MDDDEDTTEITLQAALPSLELPDFEGLRPVGVVNKLNGAGERIQRAMHYEEKVVLLVEAEVSNIGHGKTGQGMKRQQTLTVLDFYEIPGKPGRRLLNGARQAYRLADDAQHGKTDLLREHAAAAGLKITPAGYTDASGRLLSPAELAEIQGVTPEPIEKALNDTRLDPVALVYKDGTRALWPDDFPAGSDGPPAVGEFFGDLQVVEVLDGVTGETLATWTEEDEDRRLLALEAAAMEEEARGNAEAMAELEAGRQRARGSDPFVGLPGPDGEIQAKAPIEGYDELSAKQIVDRLTEMTDRDEVFSVAAWEEDHRARKTIMAAAGARAAELLA